MKLSLFYYFRTKMLLYLNRFRGCHCYSYLINRNFMHRISISKLSSTSNYCEKDLPKAFSMEHLHVPNEPPPSKKNIVTHLAMKNFRRTRLGVVSAQSTNCIHDVGSAFPDVYDSAFVESGWYAWWKEQGYFSPSGASSEKVFSAILPPPNVTGQLHLGHALTATVQDALVRWHRMRGFETVWVPGSDHAGIATQVVVEKWLQSEKGLNRHQLGREKFLQEIVNWREQKGDIIFSQLERMGASLDWTRKTFTMDESHSKAVNEAFVQLFDSGLIYRGNFLVNWSTRLQSAISDIEVDHVEVTKRTKMTVPGVEKPVEVGLIYDVAYKVFDGKSVATSVDEIVVSTTRPETILGDVAVAVHPSDARFSHLVGKNLIHPFRKSLGEVSFIPVISDESVDPKFGTGAVKVTPGHDQTDFEIGSRHGLPIMSVIGEDGTIVFRVASEGENFHQIDPESENFNEDGEKFRGLSRFSARWAILGQLKRLDLFRGQREHPMKIPVCSRSGDIVERLMKPQWFLKMDGMAARALEAAETGSLQFDPQVNQKLWGQWLKGHRDWCISRQLWWGHRIPVWKMTEKASPLETWIAAVDEDEAKFRAEIVAGNSNFELAQDDDVLDTWFSSALLPFANFGWPNEAPDLERYFPLSVMETGHDILFFWVARMVMLSQELTGKLPFKNVLLHGIICDGHGRKMSKSLGNVVDPISIIEGKSFKEMESELMSNKSISATEMKKSVDGLKKDFPDGIPKCGTDALRFGLCTYDVKGHYINLDMKIMKTSAAFCNKIWQASRFYFQSLDRLQADPVHVEKFRHFSQLSPGEQLEVMTSKSKSFCLMDRWILSQCTETISSVNASLTSGDFHFVTRSIRNFLYSNVCDVYLESIKTRLSDATKFDFVVALQVLHLIVSTSLKLVHPLMPFITEELYQRMEARTMREGVSSIMIQSYPESEQWAYLLNPEVKRQVDLLLEVVAQIRALKQFYSLTRHHRPEVMIFLAEPPTRDVTDQMKNLIENLVPCGRVEIQSDDRKHISELQKVGWSCATLSHRECDVLVNLSSHIDVTKEKGRIDAKIQKLEKDLKKLEATLPRAKFTEGLTSAVESKILAGKEELKVLENKIEFLNLIQNLNE